MTTKIIHLIRAAQAKPFIETAARLGLPVKNLARKADMPYKPVRTGDGVIGERSLWRFVELAINYKDCEHLGYITALDHSAYKCAGFIYPKINPAPFSDIATALGYSAVSNFSRAFRNATGLVPSNTRSDG